jgi:pimeloyl-ACP methyl ester carboxylesterase
VHAPFVINSNGTRIVVETFGEGRPLIFAHGLTGTRQTTQKQFAGMSERYTIITFDQRGHGESLPLTDPADYDLDEMAEDLRCVLDSLGIEQAVVGGESMGAATALAFALRYPERVEKLLLTAPAFGDRTSSETLRFKELANAIRRFGLQEVVNVARKKWSEELAWPAEVVADVGDAFLAHNAQSLATAIETVMDWVPLPNLDVLASITCPVCVIYWPDDALHPADLTLRLAAKLPNVRLVEIPPLPYIFGNAQAIGQIFAEFIDGAA